MAEWGNVLYLPEWLNGEMCLCADQYLLALLIVIGYIMPEGKVDAAGYHGEPTDKSNRQNATAV